MARHLHQQAGGDPSQGPVREMANPAPSPEAGNDFPDTPAANDDAGRGGLSTEQLDDMAARLGLTDTPPSDSESDHDAMSGNVVVRHRRTIGLAGGAATGLLALVVLRRRHS